MIRGIGLDLAETARLEKALEREVFWRRVYTEQESGFLKKKRFPAESAAGLWAAKEAALKALGTGIGPVGLREVEVLHEPGGRPFLRFHGRALERMEQLGVRNAFLSITHSGGVAAAQVILEG